MGNLRGSQIDYDKMFVTMPDKAGASKTRVPSVYVEVMSARSTRGQSMTRWSTAETCFIVEVTPLSAHGTCVE